jgi:hypothetical protein
MGARAAWSKPSHGTLLNRSISPAFNQTEAVYLFRWEETLIGSTRRPHRAFNNAWSNQGALMLPSALFMACPLFQCFEVELFNLLIRMAFTSFDKLNDHQLFPPIQHHWIEFVEVNKFYRSLLVIISFWSNLVKLRSVQRISNGSVEDITQW